MHKIDIAMGVGPGIHVNPVGKLGVHVYFRYNPAFSAVAHNYAEGELEVDGGYASYFTSGGAVSWGVISLGAEARFGGGKYSAFKAPDERGSGSQFDKVKHTLKGYRAYVSFRF